MWKTQLKESAVKFMISKARTVKVTTIYQIEQKKYQNKGSVSLIEYNFQQFTTAVSTKRILLPANQRKSTHRKATDQKSNKHQK